MRLGLGSIVVAKFTDTTDTERFAGATIALDLPEDNKPGDADSTMLAELTESSTVAELQLPAEPEMPADWETIEIKVRSGDSLARIFSRHKLSPKDVYQLTQTPQLGKRLKNIYPGHKLTLQVDADKRVMQVSYATGPLDDWVYTREGDAFTANHQQKEPERRVAFKRGDIKHSLFIASQKAGLTDNLTMRLAQIFQWDVDFVLDIRPGDKFFVLYEDLYLGEEFIGHGDILAAEFVNQGESFKALRYTDSNGNADYFAPNGESMRKAFLRAPVEFSRISSNFNLRRVHPLFNTVRPHRGIDYSAPRGTPILAAGDGRITRAGRTKPNGNFVVIQHGEQFVTKYLHLSKFARGVKTGAKVTQGQTIGYVGATGWATAPHLHYEFLVNGVHQNPRTVDLPDAKPVNKTELARFQENTTRYSQLLSSFKTEAGVSLDG